MSSGSLTSWNEDASGTAMNMTYVYDVFNNTEDEKVAGTSSEAATVLITTTVPLDMRFNDSHVISVVMYSTLMCVSAVSNLTVLFLLRQKQKHRKSRVNLLMMHLAIADLFVTFLMMPLEVGWASTVSWLAGDFMCRAMAFFRVFGLYLSSFVLVCISIDRCCAVVYPLCVNRADHRAKVMLTVAWCSSAICSIPQSIVFHVEHHPVHTWYTQCVTFNSFSSWEEELAYNLFVMVAMYGFPLLVIVATYGAILFQISQKSRECEGEYSGTRSDGKEVTLRRSGPRTLRKARSKTLRMTVIIVAAFVLCWTPYYVICLLYWFDFQTAYNLDMRIQKALFIFASSNSCLNPIVYGTFMVKWDDCLRVYHEARKLKK